MPNTALCTRHMFHVILKCETPTKCTPQARPRRVGPKRRGRGSSSLATSGRFSVKSNILQESNPPLRRNVDRRNDPQTQTTRPTSAASRTKPSACIHVLTSMFPGQHSGVSDMHASNGCRQMKRVWSQCAKRHFVNDSVSLVCGITS